MVRLSDALRLRSTPKHKQFRQFNKDAIIQAEEVADSAYPDGHSRYTVISV